MQTTRARLLLLLALLGVWILVFGLRSPGRRAGAPAAARGAPAAAAQPARAVPRLKRELIDLPRAAYPTEVHNIFAAPPTPPSAPVPASGGPALAVPLPPPPDPFVEEAKQFRFVGYLKSGPSLTAFITRGQEIHSLGQGEVLLGRYRLQAVSENDVVLASPQGDKQVRLPLVPLGGGGQPAQAQQLAPAPGPLPQRPRPFGPPDAGSLPGAPAGPAPAPAVPVPGAR